jgi:hypothetical protein
VLSGTGSVNGCAAGSSAVHQWFPALIDAAARGVDEVELLASQLVPGHLVDADTLHALLNHALEAVAEAPGDTVQDNWDRLRANANRLLPHSLPGHHTSSEPELTSLPDELIDHIAATSSLSLGDLNALACADERLHHVVATELDRRVPIVHTQPELDALLADPNRVSPAFRAAPGAKLSVNRPAAAGRSIHLYGTNPLAAVHFGRVTTHGDAAIGLVSGGRVHANDQTTVGKCTGGGLWLHENARLGEASGGAVSAYHDAEIHRVVGGQITLWNDSVVHELIGGLVSAKERSEVKTVRDGRVFAYNRSVVGEVLGGSVTAQQNAKIKSMTAGDVFVTGKAKVRVSGGKVCADGDTVVVVSGPAVVTGWESPRPPRSVTVRRLDNASRSRGCQLS